MRLSLVYGWDCRPEDFWALYFDADFTVLYAPRSPGVDVGRGRVPGGRPLKRVGADGSVTGSGAGPVRKIFGEEVVTTEVSTFDPAGPTSTLAMTPGTMADKTHIEGAIALAVEDGSTVESFSLDARVKIFGAGPYRGALHRAPGPRYAG